MPETPGHLYVVNDGGYRYLACFAESPGADRGDTLIELDPGTSWEEVLAAVARHTCRLTPFSDLDAQALDAATAVFDRTTPHEIRVEADQRLAAVHETLAIDELDGDSCTTPETTAAEIVRAYRAVAESEAAAADELQRLRQVLQQIVTGTQVAYPSSEDALRAVRERAEAALAASA